MADNDLDGAPEPFFFRHSARQILFGPGRFSELAAIAEARDVERAVVVMDGVFIGGELEARVREVLGNVIGVEVHGVPIQEPDTETVEASAGFGSRASRHGRRGGRGIDHGYRQGRAHPAV